MKRLKTAKLRIGSLIMLCATFLCCAVMAFSGIFGGLSANAIVGSNTISYIGEIWNDQNQNFNESELLSLLNQLAGNTYTAAEDVDSALANVEARIGATSNNVSKTNGYTASLWTEQVTANQIYSGNGNKDIVVYFGGLQWTATYLSYTRDDANGNKGDPIVTLWLANSSDTSSWSSGWYTTSTTYTMTKQSNIYGTSYIRSVALNMATPYTKVKTGAAATNQTSDANVYLYAGQDDETDVDVYADSTWNLQQDENNKFAKFTMPEISDIPEYLVTPAEVAWQEYENWYVFGDQNYTLGNESYGTPDGNRNYYNANIYNNTVDTKQTPNQYAKVGYEVWKDDLIWLPSLVETGYTGSKVPGVWNTSVQQRQNGAGSATTFSAESSWLRTGYGLNASNAFFLPAAGGNGNGTVSSVASVRPALHLNLASAASNAAGGGSSTKDAVSIPRMQGATTVGYNGYEQEFTIRSLSAFVKMSISGDAIADADDSTMLDENGEPTDSLQLAVRSSLAKGKIYARNAGTYTVTFSLKSEDYTWRGGGKDDIHYTLEITPAELYVQWGTTDLTYNGDPQPLSPSLSGVQGTDEYDDVLAALQVTYYNSSGTQLPTATPNPQNAGGYGAKATIKRTTDAERLIYNNYKLVNAETDLTINRATSALVWYGLDDSTEDSAFIFTYNGLAQAPTAKFIDVKGVETALTPAFTDGAGNALTATPVNAGDYIARSSGVGDAANYTFTNLSKNFTINKAPLTVTASDKTLYYGTALDDAGYGETYSGFVNNETEDVLGGALKYTFTYKQYGNITDDDGNALTFEIVPFGYSSDNYEIAYFPGKLTVNPLAITVKLADQSSVYGDSVLIDTRLGYGYTITAGALARTNDNLGITVTRQYADTATRLNAGKYELRGDWTNKNYDVTFAGGSWTTGDTAGKSATYTIEKATLVIAATSAEIPYGTILADEYTGYGVTVTGLAAADSSLKPADFVKYAFYYETAGDMNSHIHDDYVDPGEYVITLTFSDPSNVFINYIIDLEDGVLEVTATRIRISIGDLSTVYGSILEALKDVDTVADNDAVLGSLMYYLYDAENGVSYYDNFISYTEATDTYKQLAPTDLILNAGVYEIRAISTNYKFALLISYGQYTVEQAALTVYVDKLTVDYGASVEDVKALAEDNVKYVGFVNNESLDGAAGTTEISYVGSLDFDLTYAQYNAMGEYFIKAKGISFANYAVTFAQGAGADYETENLKVQAKAVTVKVDAQSGVYGDAIVLDQNAYTFVDAKNGYAQIAASAALARESDDLVVALTTSALVTSDVGNYDIFATWGNANYAVTFVFDGNGGVEVAAYNNADDNYVVTEGFEVTGATLTITANGDVRQYGLEIPADGFGYTAEGFKNGDEDTIDLAALITYSYWTTDDTPVQITDLDFSNFAMGEYAIKITVTDVSGVLANYVYSDSLVDGILEIVAEVIKVSLGDMSSVYGDAVSLDGLEVVGVNSELADEIKANLVFYVEGCEEYFLTYDAEGKVSAQKTLTPDDLILAVVAGGYKIKGVSVNPNIYVQFSEGVYTVTRASLTVTVKDYSVEYGASVEDVENVVLEDLETYIIFAGFVNDEEAEDVFGEDWKPEFSLTYRQFSGVGDTFDVTARGLVSDNYDISFVSGELTVAPKAVTVKLSEQTEVYGNEINVNSNKFTYVSADDPEVELSLSEALARVSDDLNITITTDAVKGDSIGKYSLIATFTNANYVVTFVGATEATEVNGTCTIAELFRITGAALTVTAADKLDYEYSGTAPATGFGIVVDGFISSADESMFDGILSTITYTFLNTDGSQITEYAQGTYKIVLDKSEFEAVDGAENYEITVEEGVLTIVKRKVTIAIADVNKIYGEDIVADEDLTWDLADGFTYAYGDDAESLNVELTRQYVAGTTGGGTYAGVYTITGTFSNDNYEVTWEEGAYNIGKAPLKATVTVEQASYSYGTAIGNGAGEIRFAIEYSGWVNGDDEYTNDVVESGLLYIHSYVQYSGADSYTIKAKGLTSDNYDISYDDGTLVITKVKLTVTINNQTGVYGEEVNLHQRMGVNDSTATQLDYYISSGALARSTDDLGIVLATSASSASPIGKYAITATYTNTKNYDITFVGAYVNADDDDDVLNNHAGIFEIMTAVITVKAEDGSIMYGETLDLSTLLWSASGYIGDSDIKDLLQNLIEIACAGYQADGDSNVYTAAGTTCTISIALKDGVVWGEIGNELDNYGISFETGVLTVIRRNVTITIKDQTSQYQTDVILATKESDMYSVTAGSLVGDDVLGITLETTATNASKVAYYPITAKNVSTNSYGLWDNTNYDVTVINGTWTVTPYVINIEWEATGATDAENWTWTYNGNAQGPVATYENAQGDVKDLNVYGWRTNEGEGFIAIALLPDNVNFMFAEDTSTTQEFAVKALQLVIKWFGYTGPNADSENEFRYPFMAGNLRCPTAVLYHPVTGEVISAATVGLIITGAAIEVCDDDYPYTATALVTNTNYSLPDNSSVNFWIFMVKVAGISWYESPLANTAITGESFAYAYDGDSHSPIAKAEINEFYYQIYKVTSLGETPVTAAVDAGTYKIIAYSSNPNYLTDEDTDYFVFTINPMTVSVDWGNLAFIFNGNNQAPVPTYTIVGGLVITPTVSVYDSTGTDLLTEYKNGGNYTAVISAPTNPNYQFANGAATLSTGFTINGIQITVSWSSSDNSWSDDDDASNVSLTADYIGTAYTFSATATMNKTFLSNADSNVKLRYVVTKNGEEVDPNTEILDAGTYELSVVIAEGSTNNFTLVNAVRTFIIEKADLSIVLETKTVEYGTLISGYKADITGFVTDEDEAEIIAELLDGNGYATGWLTSGYTNTSVPGTYEIYITNDEKKREWLEYILRNYNWNENVKGYIIVDVVTGQIYLVADENDSAEFIYDGNDHINGNDKILKAYYIATNKNKVDLTVELITSDNAPAIIAQLRAKAQEIQDLIDSSDDLSSETILQYQAQIQKYRQDADAIQSLLDDDKLSYVSAVNVGTYYVYVYRNSEAVSDVTILIDDGLREFTISKRTVVVQFNDVESVYGEVSKSNEADVLKEGVAWYYDEVRGYLPVDDLGIEISCNFVYTGTYADCGYTNLISGVWNLLGDELLDLNYTVIFSGSQDGGTKGLYTIKEATVIINSDRVANGGYDQTDYYNSVNPVEVSLVDANGADRNVVIIAGYQGAAIDVQFSSPYYLAMSTPKNPADASEIYSSIPDKLDRAGEWAINYKITVANHKTYYGTWLVYIEPNEGVIIVVVNNPFTVQYGDGLPVNFTSKLFEGDYFTLDSTSYVTSKDVFANLVSYAYVVGGVSAITNAGAYNVQFELNEEAKNSSNTNYSIIYKVNGETVNSGAGMFVISPRTLTVNWGETTEFDYDGEVKMLKPVISGWVNGETVKLDNISINGTSVKIDDDGTDVTIIVTPDGDFKSVGGHILSLSVDNDNYVIESTNAIKAVSIKGTDGEIKVESSLPKWVVWLLAGIGAATFLLLAITFIVLLTKHSFGGVIAVSNDDDDDGFGDPYSGNGDDDGFYDNYVE